MPDVEMRCVDFDATLPSRVTGSRREQTESLEALGTSRSTQSSFCYTRSSSTASDTNHYCQPTQQKAVRRFLPARGADTKERYTVTLSDAATAAKPTILIPYNPQALVSAFADEIFKRAVKHNINVKAETHTVTLRAKSQTGAVLDTEDVLGDVLPRPEAESIYAIFNSKSATTTLASRPAEVSPTARAAIVRVC